MNLLSAQSVLIYLLPFDFKLALTSHIVSSVTLDENKIPNTMLVSLILRLLPLFHCIYSHLPVP